MRLVDHALAIADLGIKVFPLIPAGKRPAFKGWQEAATTDPTQIQQWWNASPNANVGIPTGLDNNLLVVDLDGEAARNWWAEQNVQPGATVQSPRIDGGLHHYYRVYDIELKTSKGEVFPGIDVRAEGGLVVAPGSVTADGTYIGDLSNIPDVSFEVLGLIPERTEVVHIPYDGPQVEEATQSEARQIAAALAELDALPRVWVEGAGWRSTMYRVACWLCRMVNSPAYALTDDQALQLIMEHTPTDSSWGVADILEQWKSAQQTTAGQQADAPEESMPPMLPFLEAANALPERTSTGRLFFEVVMTPPEVRTTGTYWDARRTIIAEVLRAGLDVQHAVSVCWGAPVAVEYYNDPHGDAKLWREALRVEQEVIAESGKHIEAAPANERPPLTAAAMKIDVLTEPERVLVASSDYRWWGTYYLEWARTRVGLYNAPYHRMNLWTILSLVFSPFGYVPKRKGRMGLNLFQFVLGKTTTGKTEAYAVMKSVIKACFSATDSPNIGGDASPNALITKLLQRDGKASWFNADEAHGLFLEMRGANTWRAGLMEKWTALYEGEVPNQLRMTKIEEPTGDVTTHFVMHLMGTTEGMTKVLDAEMWESGFLARFVWAIGEDLTVAIDDIDVDQQEGDVEEAYDAMPRQWAAEFKDAQRKLEHLGIAPLPVRLDAAALARHREFAQQLHRLYTGHRMEALLKPTLIRFADIVRKCACLIALSEGQATVTLRHELIALEQAEEWLTNIVIMAGQTTASIFAREVDDLEKTIATTAGGQARLEVIYRRLRRPKFEVDRLIDQLVAEGRVERIPVLPEGTAIKIKEAIAA